MESILFRFIILAFIAMIAVTGIALLYHSLFYRDKPQGKDKIQFVNHGEQRGVVFGRHNSKFAIADETTELMCIAVGAPGTGKTSSFLVPTLKSWRGIAFVIDISDDITIHVHTEKLVFKPNDPTTTPYNLFGAIDHEHDKFLINEKLQKLAYLLMPENPRITGGGIYFYDGGRNILTAALLAFYYRGDDFIKVCQIISRLYFNSLCAEIASCRSDMANQFISSFKGVNEMNAAGCKQEADKAIKLFATSEKLAKTVRRPYAGEKCITPSALEEISVYIVLQDDMDLYSPLLNIITNQVFDYLLKRPNYTGLPVLISLDEFSSLGKMNITHALRKLRKKHCRILLLTQSMADIDLIYGKDERAVIMDCCEYKVVFSCGNSEAQEYFSRLIGEQLVRYTSKTTPDGLWTWNWNKETSTTESERYDRIVRPEELSQLGNDLILIYPDGHIRLKKNHFWRNDNMHR